MNCLRVSPHFVDNQIGKRFRNNKNNIGNAHVYMWLAAKPFDINEYEI